MDNLVIIGISETAWRIFTFVKRYNLYKVVGFAADKQYIDQDNPTYCGLPVYDIEELPNHIDVTRDYVFVAILWNHLNADRRRLYEKIKSKNIYKFASLVSPLASVWGTIGENCWVRDFVVIQEGAVIGNNVYIMDCALVAHNTFIQDHAFCAVGATICGSCVIGEQSYIGARATVFDGTMVGKKCLVGGGTIIKRNIPSFTRVKILTDSSQEQNLYDANEIENKWVSTRNVR